ncbi:hypothetical protein D3C87_1331340 [compost metagenome]
MSNGSDKVTAFSKIVPCGNNLNPAFVPVTLTIAEFKGAMSIFLKALTETETLFFNPPTGKTAKKSL